MWKFISRSFTREVINCDVAIVGAGPAGLSAAIRLKQLNPEFDVYVVEKSSEVGAHILSGNCFEPRALNELLPNWREMDSPIKTHVTEDQFWILNKDQGFKVPHFMVPEPLHNQGNFIISLSETVRWMSSYAESLGVNVCPGFAATELLMNPDGHVEGIATGDFGLSKKGEKKENYERGIEIRAKQTMIAEGCRGSLAGELMKKFKLNEFFDGDRHVGLQHYGLGIKEVWKIDDLKKFKPGLVMHTVNWPLDIYTQGGGFLYHEMPGILHIGLIVSLDYKNPHLNPYQEFQRFKKHPNIREHVIGGECIGYGARTVNKGGFWAVPKLTFPGGMLIGCSAGFLNPVKIKGTHTAMKSGMLAAEATAEALLRNEAEGQELFGYYERYRNSWIWEELYKVRSVSDGFKKNFWFGMAHAFVSYNFLGGSTFLSNKSDKKDSEITGLASEYKKIDYPKPDNKITFDLLTNLSRSGTNHESDQPSHLKIKPGMDKVPTDTSLKLFDGPEQRFCPAGVYEYIDEKLQINAQNCIHCKTCDIKTPSEYIQWTPPEGKGGPF